MACASDSDWSAVARTEPSFGAIRDMKPAATREPPPGMLRATMWGMPGMNCRMTADETRIDVIAAAGAVADDHVDRLALVEILDALLRQRTGARERNAADQAENETESGAGGRRECRQHVLDPSRMTPPRGADYFSRAAAFSAISGGVA